jgi:hypothetical protein
MARCMNALVPDVVCAVVGGAGGRNDGGVENLRNSHLT